MTRIERVTSPLPRECSATELHGPNTVYGAGEGNRTLVVSLEGFCSTIELHPPARPRCRRAWRASTHGHGLTAAKPLPYHAIRMTNLVAIAATSTAHLWWRPSTYAARWRD